MSNQRTLAWMPENEPSFLMPSRWAYLTAMAIKVPANQKLDGWKYWQLLANRVQNLINTADDPDYAMREIHHQLQLINLEGKSPTETETAADDLILNNWNLQTHLRRVGVMQTLPLEITENNPEAEALIAETDWENWINATTTTPMDNG